jgi:Na+/melibiose symporter-like transporter
LMMRLISTPGTATTVSGLRYIFSCLSALAVAQFAGIFVAPTRDGGPDLLAVTCLAAMAYVGTLWIAAASPPRSTREAITVPSRASTGLIVANRPLLFLLVLSFVEALTLPVFARSFAYIGKGLFHDPSWTGTALTTLAVAQVLALPAWMAIARRIERRRTLTLALVTIAFGFSLFAIKPAVMLAGIALFGIGNAGLQMMIWVLLADAVDHGEARTGFRCEGLPVALLLLTLKVGGGLSGALLGHGLAAIGWTAGQPIGPLTQQDLLTMAWAPSLIGTLACLMLVLCVKAAHMSGPSELPA